MIEPSAIAERARIEAVYARRDSTPRQMRYSNRAPAQLYGLQGREREMLRLIRAHRIELERARVLDVGCGGGQRLRDWLRLGCSPDRLVGVDLRKIYIEQARMLVPEASVVVAAADGLPFASGQFDLVIQSMMVSSILDRRMRAEACREMLRVLAPGGLIVWYDMRYPSPGNRDVSPIGRSQLARLFPDCRLDVRSVSLAAPIARLLAPLTFSGCNVLERSMPLLRSHLMAAIRRTT